MKNKETLVIQLFGGPGCGKSSLMGGIFSALKFNGVNCEMAPEFAKEKIWENSLDILSNQIYIFGKQHHTIFRLLNKVNVIITDSPIILSLCYGKECSESFKRLVLEEHKKLNTINIFVDREKKYNPIGRLHNEEQARDIDTKIKEILSKHDLLYYSVPGNQKSIGKICQSIIYKLENLKEGDKNEK